MAPLEVLFPNEVHTIPTPVAFACFILCGTVPLTSSISLALHGITRSVDPRTLGNLSLDAFHDLCAQYGRTPEFRFRPKDE